MHVLRRREEHSVFGHRVDVYGVDVYGVDVHDDIKQTNMTN